MQYQYSDLILDSDQPLPELRDAGDGVPEVIVRWMPAGANETAPSFASWLTPSGSEWLTFADTDDGYLLTFSEHTQFVVSRDASRVTVRPSLVTPPATTRHLLLNQVLPLVLSRRGRLVLHASAVSWNGQVTAFIGRSGSGKSTMAAACAAAGAQVVTDDCLVVRRDDTGATARWLAVPCDAGIRLWPQTLDLLGWPHGSGTEMAHYSDKRRVGALQAPLQFETEPLPLTRVVRLTRPGESSYQGPVRGRDAVMALASELFRLDIRDPSESRWQFDAIGTLAADVPMDATGRHHPSAAASDVLCRM